MEVNPYSLDRQGLVRISIMTLADIAFQHSKAFQQVAVMMDTGIVKIGIWYHFDGKLTILIER